MTQELYAVGPLVWHKTNGGWHFTKENECGHSFLAQRKEHRDTQAWNLKALVHGSWHDFGWFITVDEAKKHARVLCKEV